MLALMAAGLVGIQRAEARDGRLLVAVVGTRAEVHGTLPAVSEATRAISLARSSDLGPAFVALAAVAAAPHQARAVDLAGGRLVTVAPADRAGDRDSARDSAGRQSPAQAPPGGKAEAPVQAPARQHPADRGDRGPGPGAGRDAGRGGGTDGVRPARPVHPTRSETLRSVAAQAPVGTPVSTQVRTPGPTAGLALGRTELPPQAGVGRRQ